MVWEVGGRGSDVAGGVPAIPAVTGVVTALGRMVGTRRVLAGGVPSLACGVLTFHPGWNHLAVAFLHWAVNSCWGQKQDSSLPSAPSPPSSRAAKGLDASLLKIPVALLKLEEGMQISAKEGESSKVHFLHPPVV